MIWFSLIIPLIAVVVLFFFFKEQTTWWEYILPIVSTLVFIVLVKSIGEYSMTKDTEYWGGWTTKAYYYEDWDERVSCRHPKYRTETYPCGTSKQPQTCTRQVFDGYQHSYDVDYHPEYWELHESNGITLNISENEWIGLTKKFDNKTFVDMHRSYHSDDGDAYLTEWDGSYDKLAPVTTEHSYENRIQSSSSVYNYKQLTSDEREGLYEYVYERPLNTPSVLPNGYIGSEHIEKLNAVLGASNEVRVWVLLYHTKDREIADRQEAYWKNGNMNELVVCIGINPDKTINWSQVFSWTKNEEIKVNTRSFVESQKNLDLEALAQFLQTEIKTHWQRRDFSEFNYIQVEQPLWAIIVAFIISIISSGLCVFYAITNEFNFSNFNKKRI